MAMVVYGQLDVERQILCMGSTPAGTLPDLSEQPFSFSYPAGYRS